MIHICYEKKSVFSKLIFYIISNEPWLGTLSWQLHESAKIKFIDKFLVITLLKLLLCAAFKKKIISDSLKFLFKVSSNFHRFLYIIHIILKRHCIKFVFDECQYFFLIRNFIFKKCKRIK
jgi:hypothetical protein